VAKLTVVSTAIAPPTKQRCIDSIDAQKGCSPFVHIYVDAAEQEPRLNAMENMWRTIMMLDPTDIVVQVDGDDWLAHDRALATVEEMHKAGAWVTYGSYVFADGRAGHMREYPPDADVRKYLWLATHLKTFRASLFQAVPKERFMMNGQWLEHARDLATMFPVMEQAGPERCTFCPEVLYVYNFESSNEHNARVEDLMYEQKCVAHVRGQAPMARLEALP
jgi:hypothetical protein